jgi:hypothetical protein
MTARILTISLLFSTLTFAQNLPDAPQPKPSQPAQRMTFIAPAVKKHKKAIIISGVFAAAATAATILATRGGSQQQFTPVCACPGHVPKK